MSFTKGFIYLEGLSRCRLAQGITFIWCTPSVVCQQVVSVCESYIGQRVARILFNRLLGMDRAIVTEVPGTTRDLLEETSAVGGQRVHLIDTAGLRRTDDVVERLGVERAEASADAADIILWVLDAGCMEALPSVPPAFLKAARAGRALAVINKVDLIDAAAPVLVAFDQAVAPSSVIFRAALAFVST